MTKTFLLSRPAVAAALAVGLAACSGSTGSPTSPSSGFGGSATTSTTTISGGGGSASSGGGGSTSSGGGSASPSGGVGTLSVMMTDSPYSDAQAVLVTFSDVSVHLTGGGWETLELESGAITCDLKKLEGPVDLLAGGTLPAGKYTQIRLLVDSAGIYFDNPSAGTDACAPADTVVEPLGLRGTVEVSSGEIKLNRPFTVAEGAATSILLDFDGDRSIHQTGNPNQTCLPAGETTPSNNGRGGGAGNGGGNGNNTASCEEGNAGTFRMNPVIAVMSVDEPPEALAPPPTI